VDALDVGRPVVIYVEVRKRLFDDDGVVAPVDA